MTIVFVIAWIVAGMIGGGLALEFAYRRDREHPIDITAELIPVFFILALLGPFSLVIGVAIFAIWLVKGIIKFPSPDTVIFPAVKRDKD